MNGWHVLACALVSVLGVVGTVAGMTESVLWAIVADVAITLLGGIFQ